MTSPYDAFAWFYDRYWAVPLCEWQKPALQQLLFPTLPKGCRILDLCCGTGNLARQLTSHGYKLTGLDSSAEMLRVARQNVPQADFIQADAADFDLANPVDAAVCVFDSLNHVLEAGQLQRVFNCIGAALKPHGCFVFDINTVDAYGERWNMSATEVQPDNAFFLRGGYDREARIGTTMITMFRLHESWQRADVEIHQRPWEPGEVQRMLRAAGFTDIEIHRPVEELGMTGHYGIGRVYFRACRNSSGPGASSS